MKVSELLQLLKQYHPDRLVYIETILGHLDPVWGVSLKDKSSELNRVVVLQSEYDDK